MTPDLRSLMMFYGKNVKCVLTIVIDSPSRQPRQEVTSIFIRQKILIFRNLLIFLISKFVLVRRRLYSNMSHFPLWVISKRPYIFSVCFFGFQVNLFSKIKQTSGTRFTIWVHPPNTGREKWTSKAETLTKQIAFLCNNWKQITRHCGAQLPE